MTSLRLHWQGIQNVLSIQPILCVFLKVSEQQQVTVRGGVGGNRGRGDTETVKNKMDKK